MRYVEKQFPDFKTYMIHDQFRNIYLDLYKAYRVGDKVILNRSLSQPMYDHMKRWLAEDNENPYYKSVHGM